VIKLKLLIDQVALLGAQDPYLPRHRIEINPIVSVEVLKVWGPALVFL
jgi:hypothetical protein